MADSREIRAGMIEAEIDRFVVDRQYSPAAVGGIAGRLHEIAVQRTSSHA